jgi:hypothetical protein
MTAPTFSSHPIIKITCMNIYLAANNPHIRLLSFVETQLKDVSELYVLADNHFFIPPPFGLTDDIFIALMAFSKIAENEHLVGTFQYEDKNQIPEKRKERRWDITLFENHTDKRVGDITKLFELGAKQAEDAINLARAQKRAS